LLEFVAESRRPLNSLKSLQEQLASHPEDLGLFLKIAEISAKYKSRQEAIRWLEKLLLIDPQYRPAHEALSDLYQLTGEAENAARHRQIAASLPPPGS
jgi:tetratricopeptide (TPR) repeat protein